MTRYRDTTKAGKVTVFNQDPKTQRPKEFLLHRLFRLPHTDLCGTGRESLSILILDQTFFKSKTTREERGTEREREREREREKEREKKKEEERREKREERREKREERREKREERREKRGEKSGRGG